jgi:hypothetical protein
MVTKRFEDITLSSLATVEVLKEMIPEETKIDALIEIISIASCLTAKWDRVWTLAEKHLEVIKVAERIMKSKGRDPS